MGKRFFALLCAFSLLFVSTGLAMSPDGAFIPLEQLESEELPEKTAGLMPKNGESPSINSEIPGDAQAFSQGTATVIIDADAAVSNVGYTSQSMDDNAVRIAGDRIALMRNITVEKSGDTESIERCALYGQNAALLVTDGASATITDADTHTDGIGANGILAYGEGTVVTISNSTIQTENDHSAGIVAVGGSMVNVSDLTINTQGIASAAINMGRGGNTMTINGGTYTTGNVGSPVVRATDNISITNAVLDATASEAIVVEGKSSVVFENCTVTGNMQVASEQNGSENLHAVMLYQSMSGDADVGRSDFKMIGGSLTAKSGDLFYITNTDCSIALSDVALTLNNGTLLTVAGNDASQGWGQQDNNGGVCVLVADSQTLAGKITVDTMSSLSLTLQNGSNFMGVINPDGQTGTVNVTLDDTSTWILTADAYVTSFTGNVDQVETNGYNLHIAQ